jgi:hypothetical protein
MSTASAEIPVSSTIDERKPKDLNEVVIYAHSPILYWWPVWLYGAFCWAATAVHHVNIDPSGQKVVTVFPNPWLGISYICVLFFVVTFSNIKARGLYALLVVLLLGLLALGINWAIGLTRLFDAAQLLEIYMNQAFFAVTTVFLFSLWITVVFGVDRLSYHRFTVGQVVEEHVLGHVPGVALDTRQMIVRRLPSDFFRHTILGLGLVGLGTGDLVCRSSAAGIEPLILENVVRLSRRFKEIKRLVGMTRTD